MPFLLDRFARVRPYVFHLTHRQNVPLILRTGWLRSAAQLFELAGEQHLTTIRRPDCCVVTVNGSSISVRDQAPLHAGNVQFDEGWTIQTLVQLLNQHVFFWPGTTCGPIEHGRRHYDRYAAENPVILRIPFDALVAANRPTAPLFCKYNSGSPRCSYGQGSPRGPNTFAPADQVPFSCSQVVEVTYRDQVALRVH